MAASTARPPTAKMNVKKLPSGEPPPLYEPPLDELLDELLDERLLLDELLYERLLLLLLLLPPE